MTPAERQTEHDARRFGPYLSVAEMGAGAPAWC